MSKFVLTPLKHEAWNNFDPACVAQTKLEQKYPRRPTKEETYSGLLKILEPSHFLPDLGRDTCSFRVKTIFERFPNHYIEVSV